MSITVAAPRTKPRGEVRRSQILAAAVEVFLDKGYSGATMDLVVDRAGASKATIYNYFGDKDGLFAAIIEDRSAQILSAFGESDGGEAEVPRALSHVARRYVETLLSREVVGLCRLIIAEGPRFPDLARTFYRLGPDCVTAHLTQTFAAWRAQGLIQVADPKAAAAQFLEAVSGDLHRRAMAGILPRNRRAVIDHNIKTAVDLIWRGLKPDRGRP